MKAGPSPGDDCFPIELYYAFWTVIGEALVTILKSVITEQWTPPTFLFGRVILMPKETSYFRLLSAWRPTALFNGNYKLLIPVLANILS